MVVLVVGFGVADGRQPPDQQIGVRWALAGIAWYQRTLSARLPVLGVFCRFVPTCSRYTHVVIGEHGLWTGTRLALGRLARCGPWTPLGTVDPPARREPHLSDRTLLDGDPDLHAGGRRVRGGDVEAQAGAVSHARRHDQLKLVGQ